MYKYSYIKNAKGRIPVEEISEITFVIGEEKESSSFGKVIIFKQKEELLVKDRSEDICTIIEQMNHHLRTDLLKKDGRIQEEKLWENTLIKRQIDKRKSGGQFDIKDHIRAMVYSMLSSCVSWNRIARGTDIVTGHIKDVDEIFCDYSLQKLLQCTPEQLKERLHKIHCASPYTDRQMHALFSVNIPQLLKFKERAGTIDNYYDNFIQKNKTLLSLVKNLSDPASEDKMRQMGIPLTSEYLRNVGYDIPKPDRHIRRILSSEYFALSDKENVSPAAAFKLVMELAGTLGKPAAEVDYILWSYCADGYGGICRKNKENCKVCAAKKYCTHSKKRG